MNHKGKKIFGYFFVASWAHCVSNSGVDSQTIDEPSVTSAGNLRLQPERF
jgi:hypothetical protein